MMKREYRDLEVNVPASLFPGATDARQPLREAVQRILAVSSPNRIILFGSQARGDSDRGSDVDLMVIEPTVDNPALEAARLYRAVGWVGIGVDSRLFGSGIRPTQHRARHRTAPGADRGEGGV